MNPYITLTLAVSKEPVVIVTSHVVSFHRERNLGTVINLSTGASLTVTEGIAKVAHKMFEVIE